MTVFRDIIVRNSRLNMPGTANGTFIYFAFGSNMLERRLRENDRAPSARFIGTGFVTGRKLTFDKIGIDGSGKCDIEHTGKTTDRVCGVLFEIDRTDKASLDRAESLGTGYDEQMIQVEMESGVIDAFTYVAMIKDPGLKPFHWYKAYVVAGAMEHGLPGGYVEWLHTIEALPDPDAKRCNAHNAVLPGY